jgi:two-component system chemotaxis response regulator CheB
VIGISTGGPQALSLTLPSLTPPIPPVVIVQHMPAQFTNVFSERLNRICAVRVKEAEEGDRVLPNQILIAPGGRHLCVSGKPGQARAALRDGPLVSGHRPSIDMLFQSAALVYHESVAGFIMTGMGRDGVEGCKRILAAGGITFGQDEATSVVYGMNKAAYQEGAVQTQFALEELPALIERLVTPHGSSSTRP